MPELPRFSRSVEAGIGENFPNLQIPLRSCIPASRSPAFYNVLEKLRSGEPLTAKEKQIHDQGLVTVLRQIHDELDEAVLEAYGWEDCSGDHRSPLRCPTQSPSSANSSAITTRVSWLLIDLSSP